MDKKRSLQYNFGMDAIPILFHSQTNQFMKYLERDGLKFLNFWWNHVGDQLPEEKRTGSAGMTYEIEQLDNKTKMVIITLPTPKEDFDPYFLGFIAKPEKRVLWVRFPNCMGFALVRDDGCDQPYKTGFGYLTPRGAFRPQGVGLNPTKKDFKRLLKSRANQKKSWWKK
mgnify:CR=1 FL=1|jgi:hypothetical protein